MLFLFDTNKDLPDLENRQNEFTLSFVNFLFLPLFYFLLLPFFFSRWSRTTF